MNKCGPGTVPGAEETAANKIGSSGSHILVVRSLGRDIKERQIRNMSDGNIREEEE